MAPSKSVSHRRQAQGCHPRSRPSGVSKLKVARQKRSLRRRSSSPMQGVMTLSLIFNLQFGGICYVNDQTFPQRTRFLTSLLRVPPKKTWKDVFYTSVILDTICMFLAPASILALKSTCKSVSSLVEDIIRRQWSINRQLRQFVINPQALRSQLAVSHALISGSFALQFFERVMWRDSELDIYVQDRKRARRCCIGQVTRYLIEFEGYKLQGVDRIGVTSGPHNDVIDSLSRVRSDGTKDSINIFYTEKSPLTAILMHSWSTLLVNVISWNMAFCVFPDATLCERSSYNLQGPGTFPPGHRRHAESRIYTRQMDKDYAERGWTTQSLWNTQRFPTSIGDGQSQHRGLGDSFTWGIPLDTEDIRPGMPLSVLWHSNFNVLWRGIWTQKRLVFEVDDFQSCLLRYNYTWNGFTQMGGYPDFWGAIYAWLLRCSSRKIALLDYNTRMKVLREADIRWSPFDLAFEDLESDLTKKAWYFRENPPPRWRFWDDNIDSWWALFNEHLGLVSTSNRGRYSEILRRDFTKQNGWTRGIISSMFPVEDSSDIGFFFDT